jgi:hypothetical protein
MARDIAIVTWAVMALAVAALATWCDVRSFLASHQGPLRSGRIPNTLTVPFWVSSLVFWIVIRGWPGLLGVLLSSLIAGALLLLPGLRGGGGDLKLAAGYGAALPLAMVPLYLFLLVTGLLAANMSVRLYQARLHPLRTLTLIYQDLARRIPPVRVPGAPFLAIAALLTYWLSSRWPIS